GERAPARQRAPDQHCSTAGERKKTSRVAPWWEQRSAMPRLALHALLLAVLCGTACSASHAPADAGARDLGAPADASGVRDGPIDAPDASDLGRDAGVDAGPTAPTCADPSTLRSYLGCEFWAATLPTLDDSPPLRFAVTVTNASADPASVSIDGAGL